MGDVSTDMSLDVTTPAAPTIYELTRDDQYESDVHKRADLQTYLDGEENAWHEGFSAWAAETALSVDAYHIALDLGCIAAFDFYWDPELEEVAYEAPEIPDDWEDRSRYADIDSWSTVSAINEEMDALGETVAGVLTEYYVDWESERDIVETFGDQYNGRDDAMPEHIREDSRYE
ncbi:hypothetical protein ZOD2009_09028 [Haladaptatus paucihalophilus DX253]|uniref:DUF7992 domain-containing protein n=2 Tax=Haladaptatus paucihalophilus DX253 TaxID=797209 RepID=E7QSN0_HALPU|nr:hypothetical protein ZOD2009_09028 [Haladaptatus paucihalophilus DX253]